MIYKTVNFSQFVDAFNAAGRGEQFSHSGLKALYSYLEGGDYELDVIALCCQYYEYSSVEEAAEDLGVSAREVLDNLAVDFGEGILVHEF